jgi:phosphate starvation-inducible protein PhoH and related proteins
MAKTTKNDAKLVEQKSVDAPETLKNSGFFRRLSFKLNEEQKNFRDAIYDKENKIVFCNCKSGTGKTTIAIATACAMVEYGLYDKILYCFSLNNNFQSILGLLPGGIEEKERAFYEPCIEAVIECGYFPDKTIQELSEKGDGFISCKSHTFLRGTNIDNKTILIIDEAQNFYADELKKVLTRVKDGAKTIVIGHDGQCDIIKNRNHSGFVPYIHWFKGRPGVAVCELVENHRGWVSRVADDFDINKIMDGGNDVSEENSR